ncbi:MAG TPA: SusC/RagA family TonB-linked outer membrane protein, partial [Cyclobacteriaceae bacterium]
TPVKNDRLTWDIGLNFGLNRNKIVALDPNIKTAYVVGAGNARTATMILQEGGSYGAMISKKWSTDAQGRYIVDVNGLPVGSEDQTHLGSFNPKAVLGLSNTFTFGRFSARVLVDGRIGGVIVDGTEMNLAFSGISEVTEKHREDAWTLGGVDTDGNAVTKAVTAQQFWTAGSNSTTGQRYGIGEFFAYDATNFRVREFSVGYGIPVPSSFFIKSARISLVARNLFWLYRGSSLLDIPGLGTRKLQIDPDMSLGNGNFQGVQYGTLPSTRSLGVNVKLTF